LSQILSRIHSRIRTDREFTVRSIWRRYGSPPVFGWAAPARAGIAAISAVRRPTGQRLGSRPDVGIGSENAFLLETFKAPIRANLACSRFTLGSHRAFTALHWPKPQLAFRLRFFPDVLVFLGYDLTMLGGGADRLRGRHSPTSETADYDLHWGFGPGTGGMPEAGSAREM
jgi:hypothetical protein